MQSKFENDCIDFQQIWIESNSTILFLLQIEQHHQQPESIEWK